MALGQVEGREGVGRGVVSLIRLWKCVEKSKAPGAKPAPGARGTTWNSFASLDRSKGSRSMLLQLLLIVHGELFGIVGLVSESSTVSRQSPPIDDGLKPGNIDHNVGDLYF